ESGSGMVGSVKWFGKPLPSPARPGGVRASGHEVGSLRLEKVGYLLSPHFTKGHYRSKILFDGRWVDERHGGLKFRRDLVAVPVNSIHLPLRKLEAFALHGEGDEIGSRWRDGVGPAGWRQAGPVGHTLHHCRHPAGPHAGLAALAPARERDGRTKQQLNDVAPHLREPFALTALVDHLCRIAADRSIGGGVPGLRPFQHPRGRKRPAL